MTAIKAAPLPPTASSAPPAPPRSTSAGTAGGRAVRQASTRWRGAAAVTGSLLAVLVTPFSTFAGFLAAPGGGAEPWMPWTRALRPLVTPLLGFDTPEAVYATYGRIFAPAFLLLLIGLGGVRARVAGSAPTSKASRVGLSLARTGLTMALVGNFADYWLGARVLGQVLLGLSFGLGTLLGLLVYGAGSLLLGAQIARRRLIGLPRWTAAAFLITPVAALLLTIPAVPGAIVHLPSAPAFALGLCWLVIGLVLLRTSTPGNRSLQTRGSSDRRFSEAAPG